MPVSSQLMGLWENNEFRGNNTYMKSPLQLSVTSQLHEDDLIQGETDKIKWFRYRTRGSFFDVCHGLCESDVDGGVVAVYKIEKLRRPVTDGSSRLEPYFLSSCEIGSVLETTSITTEQKAE